jgi:hypothetical protein
MKNKTFISLLFLIVGLSVLSISCKKGEELKIPEPELAIGDTHEGGIIFYLDATKKHGLVCAPTDQSTSAPWCNNGVNITTNANGIEEGTGTANTTTIVNAQGAGSYAAQICNDLVLNGYSDWFLPSKYECFDMYFNLKIMKQMGSFTDTIYWSSTESAVDRAYSQYGNDGYGTTGGYYKTTKYYVRAVRAF